MDSMHPDPDPLPPPSLAEIRAQIARLEESHQSRGIALSGRIIHVCHHLPVEIVRVVPESNEENGGVLSVPMTPEFKPEDHDPKMESVDAKWRIHARTAHTAMISGMRSLSESHENIVVAWTGDVLLQEVSQPTPTQQSTATFSSLADSLAASNPEANGKNTPAPPREEKPLMVFGGEFSDQEKQELESELERFQDFEKTKGSDDGTLRYVPVFLPSEVSKGHYEGFCKKSACCIISNFAADVQRSGLCSTIYSGSTRLPVSPLLTRCGCTTTRPIRCSLKRLPRSTDRGISSLFTITISCSHPR
jgi:trehalose 6-phosphate synthase/phosphatase